MSKNIAIIFAGGSGARMGSGVPKQFLEVNGKPIIIHTLEIFEDHPAIDEIYVACKEEYISKLNIHNLKSVEFITIRNNKVLFIEAKKTQLNLHDLGQLWAYCKLCDPIEAFLLSSYGLGSLNKILNNLLRDDLLDFGDGKKIKKMQVGRWDITTNSIDYNSLIPKI